MIILCLGLPSSASTWAFNIVRALVSTRNPEMLGVFAETSSAFQQVVPPGATDVILKAHHLDDTLFRTIEASDSPTIVTWRDPRDATVSMAHRAGHDVRSEIPAVQRSAACILSLLQTRRKNLLVLDYATDYMNRIGTIRDIAECLNINAPSTLVDRLYKSLKTDTLRKSLTSWSKTLGAKATFNTHVDIDTHWHRNHIGDGKSDKWKHLDKDEADLLDDCLGGYASSFLGCEEAFGLPWDRIAWGVYEDRVVEGFALLKTHTRQAPIHLPRGWWSVQVKAIVSTPTDRLFSLSVSCAGKILAERLVAAEEATQDLNLFFEHRHPAETLFLRCTGLDNVDDMPISIPAVTFQRIAALSHAESNRGARKVSQEVLPAG